MPSVVSLVTLPHQNHVNMDPTMNEMTAVKTTCIIFFEMEQRFNNKPTACSDKFRQ